MAEEADRLAAAACTYTEAKAHLGAARVELVQAILDAHTAGISQADIVRATGYTREHIRRLTRVVAASEMNGPKNQAAKRGEAR